MKQNALFCNAKVVELFLSSIFANIVETYCKGPLVLVLHCIYGVAELYTQRLFFNFLSLRKK